MKAEVEKEPKEEDPADSFGVYLEYNKILRTWFVAFGVGGPALFLVNEKIAERLASHSLLLDVAALFLIGAAAQIIGALLNKIANWYVYMAGYKESYQGIWQHRWSEKFMHAFWFDFLVDVTTILCFGAAAWMMLTIFAAPPIPTD
jgi:hypothetical protein